MARLRLPGTLRALVFAALAVHVVLVVWVVVGRFGFPYEIEFMTGSVLDHVERALRHQPIYVAPSAGFIPYLYPPLYYWVCALLGGSVLACRAVSLVAAAVELVCAERIAAALGASRRWSLAAGALFLACYPYVGFWYDLERADGLLGGLVLVGAAILVRRRGLGAHVAAGALLALAVFAKQQASFYLLGAGVGLLASRRLKDGSTWPAIVAFGAAAAAVGGALFALAYTRESAWFVYYCIKMPPSHGLMPFLIVDFVLPDVAFGFAIVAATCLFAVQALRAWLRRDLARGELVFASMLAAGFAGALSSRMHIGGHVNVLLPWTTFAAIAAAVLGSRLEGGRFEPFALGALLLQLVVWGYNPGNGVPPRNASRLHARFPERVRELEREGPVLIPPRGHVTEPRHFQIAALADAVRVEGGSPPDLIRALDEQRFAAILDDARPKGETPSKKWPPILLEDIPDLHDRLLRNYFIAEWIDADELFTQLPAPALPRWVYRPRKTPLVAADAATLRARQLAEMELALARNLALARGEPEPYPAAEIELRAGH